MKRGKKKMKKIKKNMPAPKKRNPIVRAMIERGNGSGYHSPAKYTRKVKHKNQED